MLADQADMFNINQATVLSMNYLISMFKTKIN